MSELSPECALPVGHRMTGTTFGISVGQLDLDTTLVEAQTAVLRQLLEVLVDVYDAAAVLMGECGGDEGPPKSSALGRPSAVGRNRARPVHMYETYS